MAPGHFDESSVAFQLSREPVQPLPIVAKYVAQRVGGGQCYPDSETSVGAGFVRFDKVMLMAIVHERFPRFVTVGSIPELNPSLSVDGKRRFTMKIRSSVRHARAGLG